LDPCSPDNPPDRTYRGTLEVGRYSAMDVDWANCRLYVPDAGSWDTDNLPMPSTFGKDQGLYVLDLAIPGHATTVGPTLRVRRDGADGLALGWGKVPSVNHYRVHRGVLPGDGLRGYGHACLTRAASTAATLRDQVTSDPTAPPQSHHYLVVGCEDQDGAYGRDSFGAERPPGDSCR
jgi:hypothetical protein